MLKNSKGITMIALVVTIIVLLILTSITSYSASKVIESSRFQEAISEMKNIQAKVNEIYEDYRNAKTEEEKNEIINKYGNIISDDEQYNLARTAFDEVADKNISDQNLGEFEDYRYWSKDYILETLDVEGIKYDFIVNIKL